MMTHTKGPWLQEADGYIVKRDDGGLIARNLSLSANGHLIAAAPELLEALRKISKGEGPFKQDRLEHCEAVVESMMRIASEAIAKADAP